MNLLQTSEANTIDKEVDSLLNRIYKPGFAQVARFVVHQGGSFDDARDLFHDALEVFCEKYEEVRVPGAEVAYVTGIARNLWFKKMRRESNHIGLEETVEPIAENPGQVNEITLLKFLEKSGRRCMELLMTFYESKLSMKKVVEMFGFTSEHSAAVQKYKCIEKLRDQLKTKAYSYEDFFE